MYRNANHLVTIDVCPRQEAEEQQDNDSVKKGTVRFRSPSPTERPALWSSPAFARSLTASIIADAEQDGFLLGRDRKRTKFGRLSSEWIYVDSPPSPFQTDAEASEDEEGEEKSAELSDGDVEPNIASPSSPLQSGENAPELAEQVGDRETLEADAQPSFRESPHVMKPSEDEVNADAETAVAVESSGPQLQGITEQSLVLKPEQVASPQPVSHAVNYPAEPMIDTQVSFDQTLTAEAVDDEGSRDSNGAIFEPQKDTILSHGASTPAPFDQEHADLSPVAQEPLYDGLGDRQEKSSALEVESESETGGPLSVQEDTQEICRDIAGVPAVENTEETHPSDSELEGAVESRYEEADRAFVRGQSWEYSASETSHEESECDSFSTPSKGQGELSPKTGSHISSSDVEDPEVSEMQDNLSDRVPYISQEVIVLDSDDEETSLENQRAQASERPDTQATQHYFTGHGRAVHEPRHSEDSSSVEFLPLDARKNSGSESAVREQESNKSTPNRASTQEAHRRSLSVPSSGFIEGGPNEIAVPIGVPLESNSQLSTILEPQTESRFPVDSALFLDGAGSDPVAIESTALSNMQLITPSNTQPSLVSFHQIQTSAINVSQHILTPEHSTSLISRRSYSEYATETEPTFNSIMEGSFQAFQPDVTDLLEHRPPSSIPVSVESSIEGSIAGHEGTSPQRIVDEAVRQEKHISPIHSPELRADTLGPMAETPKRHDSQTDRHISGLRTKLSYFCPLSHLIDYFNQSVDTISAVTSVSPISQAGQGPQEYFVTLHVTDRSSGGNIVCVQVFCKDRSFLPTCARGDVILLRNFKVGSIDRKMMLSSMGDSSWAVFIQGKAEDAQVKSAPVEFGDEELDYIADLRRWFVDEGEHFIGKSTPRPRDSRSVETSSSIAPSENGSVSSRGHGNLYRKYRRKRKSNTPRLTMHELRNGRRYLDANSPSDKDSIHELRDGTVYAHP